MIDNPEEIEKRSFEILEEEIDFEVPEELKPLVYRIIHTTADFEYAKILEIFPGAVQKGMAAIKNGCRIYADTNMIKAGVNKKILEKYNSEIYTLVADDEVVAEAKERGVTRSIVGLEKACKDSRTKIFAIGNAPTALFTLREMIRNGGTRPELVIGVPVGFVGAAESKEEFKSSGVPYIITKGRKGGSTIAVAALNAIMYQIR